MTRHTLLAAAVLAVLGCATAHGSNAAFAVTRAASADADSRPPLRTAAMPAASDTYDPTQTYVAGCVVIFQSRYFKAKWWANVGESPAAIDPAQPWLSPWEEIAETAPGCDGDTGGPGPGGPDPLDPVEIPLSQLLADEARLTDFPLMQQTLASIRTLPNTQVQAVEPLRAANPENVRRVEALLDAAQFDDLFPMRAPEYTYRGFLQAFAKFPAICASYTDGRDADAICRRTLATMVAHFAQETGGHDAHSPIPEWRQALVHVREMGWSEETPDGYAGECNPATWQGQTWPCGVFESGPHAGRFKSYFGRGAKQLSYNYNYGPFSDAMFGTVRTLLDQPELVADTWLNLASAAFFYMYPQPPKPSMMHVIDGTWQPNARDLANGLVPGFGVTTQIINGGVECGGSTEHLQSQNRITYYRAAAAHFNVPVPGNEVLGCKGMKQFDEGGAGALPIY
jgi:chitodextrinase